MALELHVFPPSPRAFKVLAVANHLGLPYEQKIVNLANGGQRDPAFAALNPNMRMPVLKDGDYVLWESNAICQYLATQKPESGLLPRDDKARIDVTRWQFWELAHWDSACAVYMYENVVKAVLLNDPNPDAAALAKAEPNFHRAAKVLDDHLRGRNFVVGNALTLADFSLGAALNPAPLAKYPLEAYGEIKRWFAGISALPAWQKTLKAAGLA
jgi:glutathione S-transferase